MHPLFAPPQETEAKLSPSWNPRIICEPHPQFTEPVSSATPFEPMQIGHLSGRIDLSLVLKQNQTMPGAKVWSAFSHDSNGTAAVKLEHTEMHRMSIVLVFERVFFFFSWMLMDRSVQ